MSIAETILLVSSITVALGIIFTALKMGWVILRKMDQLSLLLGEMVKQLGNTPNAFQILEQIIAQFRTNSGSSLKDQINNIENAIVNLTELAKQNKQTTSIIASEVETVRELSALRDRQGAIERARIMSLIQYLEGGVAVSAASSLKAEETAIKVADDLSRRDKVVAAAAHPEKK